MRLFFYYISHTFVNTIKKLMKTWVAIIVIMMVFGALIGFASSFLGRDSDGDASGNEITVETVDEEEGSLDGEIESTMDEWRFANIMKKYDLTKEQVVDLAISALFLLLLATNIINSQNCVTSEAAVGPDVQTDKHAWNVTFHLALHALPDPEPGA